MTPVRQQWAGVCVSETGHHWPQQQVYLNMTDFLQAVRQRVVIYDGAMGTNIQFRNATVDDFWGKEGCNELLVLSRPHIIKDIHSDFFRVGCDVDETDTFGATRVVLAEYDLQDKVAKINIAAAKIAREVAQQFSTKTSLVL
ncbi:MAG: hypothetical protein NVS1B11_02000 [Terriglobales bacterium]